MIPITTWSNKVLTIVLVLRILHIELMMEKMPTILLTADKFLDQSRRSSPKLREYCQWFRKQKHLANDLDVTLNIFFNITIKASSLHTLKTQMTLCNWRKNWKESSKYVEKFKSVLKEVKELVTRKMARLLKEKSLLRIAWMMSIQSCKRVWMSKADTPENHKKNLRIRIRTMETFVLCIMRVREVSLIRRWICSNLFNRFYQGLTLFRSFLQTAV